MVTNKKDKIVLKLKLFFFCPLGKSTIFQPGVTVFLGVCNQFSVGYMKIFKLIQNNSIILRGTILVRPLIWGVGEGVFLILFGSR
jgi:hypothetical protein